MVPSTNTEHYNLIKLHTTDRTPLHYTNTPVALGGAPSPHARASGMASRLSSVAVGTNEVTFGHVGINNATNTVERGVLGAVVN